MATKTLQALGDAPATAPGLNGELLLALAALRVRGFRNADVARAAGLSACTLSSYVHGHRRPSRDAAERVAAVIGQPVEALWPELTQNDTTAAGAGDRGVTAEDVHGVRESA
jgi:transcriptional regulator with XRE-family HTH domain